MYLLHHFFGFTLMRTYLIFYLLILLGQITTIRGSDAAVCYLSVRPEPKMLDFAEKLALDGLQYGVDVYVIVDDNAFKVPSRRRSKIKILQIPNEKCIAYGYRETMYIRSRRIYVASWDKAFLYFGELNTNYSFVWFIEDDVFIPSVQAFRSVHQLYSPTSDLIVQSVISNPAGNVSAWVHWHLAVGHLFPPWYTSMTNAVGLSRRLLTTIADHIRWRGISTFHEYMLQTFSINLNMTVVSPVELNTLVYRKTHRWRNIDNRPNNWWHPVKDWNVQKEWHDTLV